jgi:putative nucleotidyltransferase with HDIG domain
MTANEFVARAKNIRLASHAALQLVTLLDQPTVSNESVVQILKHDNILTAKLLRACNSPYFGLRESVASVDQAVFLLGHLQILQIVLTLEFSGTMVVPLPGYALEAKELWRHSLATASAAEVVVKDGVDGVDIEVDPAVAFTVGLLHDIGKLVMGQILTEDHQAGIRSQTGTQQFSRIEAEKQALGTDHAEVGALLLQNWRLPKQIVEAVANHHDPVLRPRPTLSVVAHLADVAAHLADSPSSGDVHAINVNENVAATFGITPEKLEVLVLRVSESFERVDALMRMA